MMQNYVLVECELTNQEISGQVLLRAKLSSGHCLSLLLLVILVVKSLLITQIKTKFISNHVVLLDDLRIFWLLRLLWICSSLSDLRGHVIDGKTQFIPSMSS